MSSEQQRIRALLAKIGFDGHDRGIKVVARILRDAGIEVIYAGLRQTPDMVASLALQEDVDVIALSMHNGAHLTLAPDVVQSLRAAGLRTPVVLGGIIPAADRPRLEAAGVTVVLGPGASADDVLAAIRGAATQRSS